jgi:hypothetical protein
MYRAYYAGGECRDVPALEKDRWPFREFQNLDDALLWTRGVVKHGTSVIAIEGDDGTHLTRGEIAGHVRQALPGDS